MTNPAKLTCQICEKIFRNIRGIAQHVRLHGHTTHSYYDEFLKSGCEGSCLEHGNPTKFLDINAGYQKRCGRKCAASENTKLGWHEKRRQEQKSKFSAYQNLNGRTPGSKNKRASDPEIRKQRISRLAQYAVENGHAWIGRKHKAETREKMSATARKKFQNGHKVRNYQGKFKPRSPERYEGDSTNICYRSSWELSVMLWLDANPFVTKWSSEEVVIGYVCKTDNKWRSYFIDFKVTFDNGKTVIIEVKPKCQVVPPVKTKNKRDSTYLTEEIGRASCRERVSSPV